jgi:hypothetical protein
MPTKYNNFQSKYIYISPAFQIILCIIHLAINKGRMRNHPSLVSNCYMRNKLIPDFRGIDNSLTIKCKKLNYKSLNTKLIYYCGVKSIHFHAPFTQYNCISKIVGCSSKIYLVFQMKDISLLIPPHIAFFYKFTGTR